MEKGRLFVISGPSGTGKGTICTELLKRTDAALSVSMTTRQPRPHERHGESYFFVDRAYFMGQIESGGLFEHAEVYGELYGTPKEPVERQLAEGRDVILEIEMQGAMQVKRACPDGVFIFVLPPSMGELRRRIEMRGSESPEKIGLRLGKAMEEIGFLPCYDYAVVNGSLKAAVDDTLAIMRAERLRVGADAESVMDRYRSES